MVEINSFLASNPLGRKGAANIGCPTVCSAIWTSPRFSILWTRGQLVFLLWPYAFCIRLAQVVPLASQVPCWADQSHIVCIYNIYVCIIFDTFLLDWSCTGLFVTSLDHFDIARVYHCFCRYQPTIFRKIFVCDYGFRKLQWVNCLTLDAHPIERIEMKLPEA